jgi:hypothetical protein
MFGWCSQMLIVIIVNVINRLKLSTFTNTIEVAYYNHSLCCQTLKNINFPMTYQDGEGSSAQNSSARKICSTPKSRLLDTKSGTRTA